MHSLDLRITRVKTSDHGTLGVLAINGFACYTLELPWRDNKPFISCIPDGVYTGKIDYYTRKGRLPVIRFDETIPNRYGILIHVGNYAGDVSLGLKSSVEGCICVGHGKDEWAKQEVVSSSHSAMEELLSAIGEKNVRITIENLGDVVNN